MAHQISGLAEVEPRRQYPEQPGCDKEPDARAESFRNGKPPLVSSLVAIIGPLGSAAIKLAAAATPPQAYSEIYIWDSRTVLAASRAIYAKPGFAGQRFPPFFRQIPRFNMTAIWYVPDHVFDNQYKMIERGC